MEYKVNLMWDEEACVWVAFCDEAYLALESGSLETLMKRVELALPEVLELNNVAVEKPLTLYFVIKSVID